MQQLRQGAGRVAESGGCPRGRALDESQSREVVRAALDAGVDDFDTSDNYGGGRSKGYLSQALGSHRPEVVIATKFGMPVSGEEGSGGARPDYIRRAFRRSLTCAPTLRRHPGVPRPRS